MEADFNRINVCSQQLKDIAVKLRKKIYEVEELKSGIARQSGTGATVRLAAAAADGMESESFLLFEMSNMLEVIARLYAQTESDIQNSLGRPEFGVKPINVGTLYFAENASNGYKEYFKL